MTSARKSAIRDVDRRDILRTGAAAFFALSVPGWSGVFGQAAGGAQAARAGGCSLQAAIERARRRGLPLLVLRAPDDPLRREQLGEMWGSYLTLSDSIRLPDFHTRNRRLADLCMCEIVCALDADVVSALPGLTDRKGWADGIALIVEPEDGQVLVVPGPLILVPWMKEHAEREAGKARLVGELDQRLHALLAPDVDTLRRRAQENFATLDEDHRSSLYQLDASTTWATWSDLAERAPACLRALVETSAKLGAVALRPLAARMSVRIRGPLEGARWETPWWERTTGAKEFYGCAGGPCGTGYSPAPSVRFLRFFTGPEEPVPAGPAKK